MKQVKDYYFHKAKDKNYSARSIFKLEEINKKYHLIKKGMNILDLGASPGSWIEYAIEVLGSSGKIIAVDLNPLQTKLINTTNQIYFVQEDVSKLTKSHLPDPNMKFNLILSDMAPKTSGNKGLDHQRSLDLCVETIKISNNMLKIGGNLVCKVFQGEDLQEFISNDIKPAFKSYKLFKPKSSRKESVEIFILGFTKI